MQRITPTYFDTALLAGHMPRKSSPIISKFEALGGIVLGKARMHELAEGFTTISDYYGPTLNPYRNDFHVGGESSQDFTLSFQANELKLAVL